MIGTRAFSHIGVLLVLLLATETASSRIVPRRDARQGILDAELVAIVSQRAADEYRIEEVFWGDARVGDSIRLKDFNLFTKQQYGSDIIDPISPATRILLFLQHKKGDMSSWEPTDYGYCFFWVQEPARVFELRNIAQQAVALRRRWEDATKIPDPRKRVEALWPYLRLREYGTSFLEHTKVELRKVGPVAGDYFAEQFDAMPYLDRSLLYYESGSYGSERLHQTLIRHLKNQQQAYEGVLAAHGLEGKAVLENWNSVPQDIQGAYSEVPSLLYGLRSFADRADLPLIRDVAIWAVKHGVDQACEMALGAFREMPDKDNLPTIESIWRDLENRPSKNKEIIRHDVIGALCAHRYSEAVPLLARFVAHRYAGPEVNDALSQIVGRDLGRDPKAWLDWYEKHKPLE